MTGFASEQSARGMGAPTKTVKIINNVGSRVDYRVRVPKVVSKEAKGNPDQRG